jgi:hypothetical protein
MYFLVVRSVAFVKGAVFENHRKKWISGLALGAIHHSERRLSTTHELSKTFDCCTSVTHLFGVP